MWPPTQALTRSGAHGNRSLPHAQPVPGGYLSGNKYFSLLHGRIEKFGWQLTALVYCWRICLNLIHL
ncbi:hypothetical protein TKWG_09570 [Advenella kashmirensis WT001]|uniref:Uncharacterized protein n=1 Tax=Advenella kashmirensis (strain DSM 17095 / LMG 22695 / WT001) TaxID=1036672 RepID=I3UB41_ADVKW|nr:hypothetical protein TKWG_09570 [Advenella kashmirensis WT001]